MPTLYLVPIPLSNPDDITLRALRILQTVSAVAAADPAAAQALLDHHRIEKPIIGYGDVTDSRYGDVTDSRYEDVTDSRYGDVIHRLIASDVALVAASGTPGIGDPAHDLVVEAIRRGVRVEPLPGANAPITALVLSGLPTDAFAYFDAIPDDLSRLARDPDTLIFRSNDVVAALEHLARIFDDRQIAVSLNLTQPDEIVYRGTLRAALADLRAEGFAGAALIVLAGAPPEIAVAWDEARVRAELRRRLAAGDPLKQIAKQIAAQAGWDRRSVYALGVEEKQH